MTWYWVIFGILAVTAFLEQFAGLRRKHTYRLLGGVTVILIFISSIRWNQIAGDWQGYYSVYQWFQPESFFDIFKVDYWPFEPVYYMATRFIRYFFNSYTGVQVMMAVLALGFFYLDAKYLDTHRQIRGKQYGFERSTIACTFLLAWSTECLAIFTIRTSVAYAMCVYAIRYIEEKNMKKFMLMIAIATGFHFTSIVFIPAYFIYHLRISLKTLVRYAAVAAAVSAIGVQNLIPLIGLLGGRYAGKAIGYNFQLTEGMLQGSYSVFFVVVKGMANTVFIVIIGIYVLKYSKSCRMVNERVNGLVNLYCFGALLQFVTISYNVLFARAAVFYLYEQYYIVPVLLQLSKNKPKERFLYFCAITAYCGVKLYTYLGGAPHYASYTTIFSK